jgi:hypothetical protein
VLICISLYDVKGSGCAAEAMQRLLGEKLRVAPVDKTIKRIQMRFMISSNHGSFCRRLHPGFGPLVDCHAINGQA